MAPRKKLATPAQVRNLPEPGRSTVGLVIDHCQPHFGLDKLSIHILQVHKNGNRHLGFDIDGITKKELGIAEDADLLQSLTGDMLVKFVESIPDAAGLTVSIDTPPPAPDETDEAE